ncbi:hypothetical protein IAU59_006539 [Kwoniella sp. CBS 9459]
MDPSLTVDMGDPNHPPSANDIKVNIGKLNTNSAPNPKKRFKLSSDSPVFTPSSALLKTRRETLAQAIEKGKGVLFSPQAEHEEPREEKEEPKKSPFTIVGPDVPWYMELSSSEGSSNETTHLPPPPAPIKDRNNMRLLRSQSHPGNASPLAAKSANQACQEKIRSPVSEPIDWIAFSNANNDNEQHSLNERGSSWDGGSWSDEAGAEADTPIIITPELSGSTRRQGVTIGHLTSLLEQNNHSIYPPTPLSSPASAQKPRIRRISKSPELSAIASVSKPSTPFMNPVVLPPSPRSRTQSAPGRTFRLGASLRDLIKNEEVEHEESDKNKDTVQKAACAACDRQVELTLAKKMIPCHQIVCPSCFSSTLSAVSVTNGHSHCPACLKQVTTFEKIKDLTGTAAVVASPPNDQNVIKRFGQYPIPVAKISAKGPIVMRIDNVAWDITPALVEAFLPGDTLSKTALQAIHIPINRFDGRTKDYLYIEVDSVEAGQLILKTKQNTFMTGGPLTGGKRRPVTITPVSHSELLLELRPHSSQELHSLLRLCQASLGPPTPITRFLKSRHGAFYALMSTMSKLAGKMSPIYWDLFHVASGAIAVLAQTIHRQTHHPHHYNHDGKEYSLPYQTPSSSTFVPYPYSSPHYHVYPPDNAENDAMGATLEDVVSLFEDDQAVLDKFLKIFEACFGMVPRIH